MSELSKEQHQALVCFAKREGRYWKSKLKWLWSVGLDDRQPDGAILRQIRNDFGAIWLVRFKLENQDGNA